MEPDPGTVYWLSGIMVTALSAGGAWAWNHTHKRIDGKADIGIGDTVDKVERRITEEVGCFRGELRRKADNEEMVRQRANIADLFKGQQAVRDEMHQGFQAMQKTMSDTHITILEKLNELGRGVKHDHR